MLYLTIIRDSKLVGPDGEVKSNERTSLLHDHRRDSNSNNKHVKSVYDDLIKTDVKLIESKDIEFISRVGVGAYGEVWKVLRKCTTLLQ